MVCCLGAVAGSGRGGGEGGGGKVNWNSNESARVIVPSKKKKN